VVVNKKKGKCVAFFYYFDFLFFEAVIPFVRLTNTIQNNTENKKIIIGKKIKVSVSPRDNEFHMDILEKV